MDTKPKKAVIYCRVSSKSQTIRGDGLGSQETICREYARWRGYEVVDCFRDDLTGKQMDRPGVQSLLTYLRTCRKEPHIVIVDDISRLARSLRAHMDLRDEIHRLGARLESPTTQFSQSHDLGLEEGMKALFAQEQRIKNAEQTQSRRKGRVMNGYWPFAAPLGYRHAIIKGVPGKLLVRDEPVASIVQEALEGYASGRFQLQAEVGRFFESFPEFPRDSRGLVRNQQITDILTRSVYAGYVEAPKFGVPLRKGNHDPLISYETHLRIQERLNGNARIPSRKNLNEDFPLRGAVACGHCGTSLTACWSKGRLGYHPYYLCHKRGCSSYGKSIRRSVIEREFEDLLKGMQPSSNLFQAARAMFKDIWDHRLATGVERTKALKAELLKVNGQVEQFLDRIADATVPSVITAYETRIKALEDRKIVLAEKIAASGRPVRSFDETLRTAFDFLASPCQLWISDRLEDKRAVLKLAFSDRLIYVRNEGFRTPKLSLPFKNLGHFEGQELTMARAEGFEPSTVGFGVQCSAS